MEELMFRHLFAGFRDGSSVKFYFSTTPGADRQKPDAWYRHHCVACLIAGSRCMLVWPFQTKFSHPLTSPWTPGSLCVSQQSLALSRSVHETFYKYHIRICCISLELFFKMMLLYFSRKRLILSSFSISTAPLSPSRPKLSSFLPSHSFLHRLLSLQKTWHSLSPVKPTLTFVVPHFSWPSVP